MSSAASTTCTRRPRLHCRQPKGQRLQARQLLRIRARCRGTRHPRPTRPRRRPRIRALPPHRQTRPRLPPRTPEQKHRLYRLLHVQPRLRHPRPRRSLRHHQRPTPRPRPPQSHRPHPQLPENNKRWLALRPESQDADTTVSGAQMVALFAARNAGLPVPDPAIKRGIDYFISCQASNGGFGYTSKAAQTNPDPPLAASSSALAKEENSKAYKKSLDYLAENSLRQPRPQILLLYYTSQAMFRASPKSGGPGTPKTPKASPPPNARTAAGRAITAPPFSTSAALLSLALNYRYLPIYER